MVTGTFYFGIRKLLAGKAFVLKFLHILAVFNGAYPPRPQKSVISFKLPVLFTLLALKEVTKQDYCDQLVGNIFSRNLIPNPCQIPLLRIRIWDLVLFSPMDPGKFFPHHGSNPYF